MNYLFPHKTLDFDDLLSAVGKDFEPLVPRFEEHQLREQQCKIRRARMLYTRATDAHCRYEMAHEFVSCFGRSQQPELYEPFAREWKNGRWGNKEFGCVLRRLIKAGPNTSDLLDLIGVDQLCDDLRALPLECRHTPSELALLRSLPERIQIHRGGWDASAADLINRSVSWTLDDQTAESFIDLNIGCHSGGQRPFHLVATIDLSDVLVCFEHEEELIIDPASISNWIEVESYAVKRRMPLVKKFASSSS